MFLLYEKQTNNTDPDGKRTLCTEKHSTDRGSIAP